MHFKRVLCGFFFLFKKAYMCTNLYWWWCYAVVLSPLDFLLDVSSSDVLHRGLFQRDMVSFAVFWNPDHKRWTAQCRSSRYHQGHTFSSSAAGDSISFLPLQSLRGAFHLRTFSVFGLGTLGSSHCILGSSPH